MDGIRVFFSKWFPDLEEIYSDFPRVTEVFFHDLQSSPLGLAGHSERGASVLLRNPEHPSLQPLLTLSCLPHHPLQKLLVPPPSRWPGCRSQTTENTQASFLLSWDAFLTLGIKFEISSFFEKKKRRLNKHLF